MKIRGDFVTNSSSSSFVLARRPEFNERQKEAILDYVEGAFLGDRVLRPSDSEEVIEKKLEGTWALAGVREEVKSALNRGLTVYVGDVSFEDMDWELEHLHKWLWKEITKHADEGHEFEILDGDLSY